MSIPEIRGMDPVPYDRERPYSAASYAAQYGISIREAQDLIESSTNHKQVERQIVAMFKNDDALKKRALFIAREDEPSEEETRRAERWMARAGLEGGRP